MPKRIAKIIGLITVWIGLSQSSALACLCVDGARNEYLQMADAVFAGRVIAENQKVWSDRIGFEWSPPFIIYANGDFNRAHSTFEVTTIWKGGVTARTSVIHGLNGDCGYRFKQGEEYLVYAKLFKGELLTDQCWINKLSDAGMALAALGAGKPPAPNPSPETNYIIRLIIVLMLLSMLGWAVLQALRKYGVQKS